MEAFNMEDNKTNNRPIYEYRGKEYRVPEECYTKYNEDLDKCFRSDMQGCIGCRRMEEVKRDV